jgi:alkylhydroperoxidase family enzyme
MPRIAPVAPPYSSELAARFARLMPPPFPPLNLYRTVACHPQLFSTLVDSGLLGRHGLAWFGTMSRGDRELLILRTTARAGATYEWQVHVRFFGKSSGLSPAQIVATTHRQPSPGLWTPRQWLILRLADALIGSFGVDDELWSKLENEFDHPELIEFATLCGFYLTASMLINMCGVAPEMDVPAFPGPEESP